MQAQTHCCIGCKVDEITWRSRTAAQNDTCLACIDCPDGTEPSIACGTVAKYGTHLHCVACREGTYSDSYDKGQCKPCSLCSAGRSVARNCSATKNTRCGSCSHGYYKSDFVFDCLPCSGCCWDGKDQLESQCKAQGLPRHRHCKPRHESGCQTASTTKKANSVAIKVLADQPATRQTSESQSQEITVTLSPTTREQPGNTRTRNQTNATLALSTTAVEVRKETAPTTGYPDKTNRDLSKNKRSVNRAEIKNRVIQAVSFSMVILITLVLIAKRKKLANYVKWARCHPICKSSDVEFGVDTESTVLDDIRAQLSVEPKGGK